MLVASVLVLPNLEVSHFRAKELAAHPEYANMLPSQVDGLVNTAMETYAKTDPAGHLALKAHDLKVVMIPYAAIAAVVLLVLLLFAFSRMPDTGRENEKIKLGALMKDLFRNVHYVGGVIAQTFYVGAQIMCWTFIIHYAMGTLGEEWIASYDTAKTFTPATSPTG